MQCKNMYWRIGLRINSINNFSNNAQKKAQNTAGQSTPNFGSYKLIKEFPDPNYTWIKNELYELSNKMKILFVPKTGPDSISVNNTILTGAINEVDGLRGGSHFLEHLTVLDGSKDFKPGQLSKIMEDKGALLNAYTKFDMTAYFFNIANPSKKDLETLIKLQANSIIYPKPPNKSYEKEKAVVIQEIKQSADSPYRKVLCGFINDIFGLSPDSVHSVLGSIEDIANMSKKNIMEYHNRTYVPNNSEMYISGAVNPKELIKVIDKYYDVPEYRPSTLPMHYESINPIQKTKISFYDHPRVGVSSVIAGFIGPKNADVKELAMTKVLMDIFANGRNSRLSQKLQSSLNAESSSDFYTVSNNSLSPKAIFFNFSPVRPGNEQKLLDVFKETLNELKTKSITQEELDISKKRLLDEFNSAAETSSGITSLLENFSTSGGINAYANSVKHIESLTIDDINKMSTKYLDPNKAAISILQPSSAQNKEITFTGKALISPKAIKKFTLPNKVKLVINDTADKIRTVANLKIEGNVQSKPGTSIILSTLMQNSTAKHSSDEFALLKARVGVSSIAANDTSNGLAIGAASRKESFADAIKLVKEIAFEPAFTQKNFDLAKDEIKQIIDSVLPTAKDRALEAMYGHNHPEGQTARYLAHVIDDVTLADVQDYYNALMKNPKVSATITGPISKVDGLNDKIIEELSKISGNFSNKKTKDIPFELPKNNKVIVQLQDSLEQSENTKFFHIDTSDIKDFASMKVLDKILGGGLTSRLFMDLREKQKLAYSVHSKFLNSEGCAQEMLDIRTGIKDDAGMVTDNIEKSLVGFSRHINKLINTLPSADELTKAKKSLLNYYTRIFATAFGTNAALVEGAGTKAGLAFYNKLLKEIANLTPQDIQNVAKKQLTKPSVTSILTTEEALNKSKGFLEKQGEIKIFTKKEI